jgi:hypothetical protein
MATKEQLAAYRARTDEEILALTPAEKTCRRCGAVKPGDQFSRDRSKPDGRDTRCRQCSSEVMTEYRSRFPERARATQRRSYRKNYNRRERPYRLKRLYGLTLDEYEAMRETQGGMCAICRRTEAALANSGERIRDLSVDHCHETGTIRGLLCARCNSAIGLLGHNQELLLAAVRYLRETE